MSVPHNIYGAVGLTEGEASLNKIPVSLLNDKDFALVSYNNSVYIYSLNSLSNLDENIPSIIKPSDITILSSAEDKPKRWILQKNSFATSENGEGDILDGVNNESLSNNLYKNSKFIYQITNWTQSGSLYYSDIRHNKESVYVVCKCYIDNSEVIPSKIDCIDSNNIRIWFPTRLNVFVVII